MIPASEIEIAVEIEVLTWDKDLEQWNVSMVPPEDAGSGDTTLIPEMTGLSMGWVYVFMGNMIGSAVMPVAFAITAYRPFVIMYAGSPTAR